MRSTWRFGPTLVVASVLLSAVACTEANRRLGAEPAHLTETRLSGKQLDAALLTEENLGPRFTRIPQDSVYAPPWRAVAWHCLSSIGTLEEASRVTSARAGYVRETPRPSSVMNQVLSFPDAPAATRAFAAVRTVMSSCTTDKGFTTSGSEDEVRVTITADSVPVETADEQLNLTLRGAVGGCCDDNGKLIRTSFEGQVSLVRAANLVSIVSLSTTRRADLDALTRLSMHRLAAVSQRTDTAEPSDSPRAEVGGELTGFGATRTAWESQHGPEVPNNNDDAYGTKVDDEQYEYSSVSFQPRVLSYLRAFPRHTTLAEAETILLRDFPSDAGTSVTDKDERRCRIVLIESARLQDVLGDWAIASFYGRRQAFDADDVAAAYVTVHRSRRARDLGVC
jgi:hypothetical protein